MPTRAFTRSALLDDVALALACLATYVLVVDGLSRVYSLSDTDNRLGAMWAVIATIFVYRTTDRESTAAATGRAAATLISFAVCAAYLAVFPFHPVGLAASILAGRLIAGLAGRTGDDATIAITTTVVLVVAAGASADAWQIPWLRLVDTFVGVATGLIAARPAARARHRLLAHDEQVTSRDSTAAADPRLASWP